ncbi:MAG TPA: hypothetical protein VF120_18295, partial [Ktedonobacterales bacterium]
VDSYMSRHKTQAPRPQGQPGQSILPWGAYGIRFVVFGVLAGALILAAIFSAVGSGGAHGFWFPWFFLPWLFFLMFARRGMYRSRRTYTYTDENGQQVWVRERSRGYGPGYGPGNGPNGPRGPYNGVPNSTPGQRTGDSDPNERYDPDGRSMPPRADASAASDIQSRYGAPDRPGYSSDERTQ